MSTPSGVGLGLESRPADWRPNTDDEFEVAKECIELDFF